jgi:hypothetical protein
MSYSTRTAPAVALSLLAVLAVTADVRAGAPRRVIRVYDHATGIGAARTAGIRTAAVLLAEAGIDADWRDCTTGGAHAPCLDVRSPADLVVRIAPRYVADAGTSSRSISARQTVSDQELQLGFASFDPKARIGVMATLFHDHLWAVANRTAIEYSELLGRAMAHEVGHLILLAAGHSRHGLMRAVWTDAELAENRHEDWVFSADERHRLQAASAGRLIREAVLARAVLREH